MFSQVCVCPHGGYPSNWSQVPSREYSSLWLRCPFQEVHQLGQGSPPPYLGQHPPPPPMDRTSHDRIRCSRCSSYVFTKAELLELCMKSICHAILVHSVEADLKLEKQYEIFSTHDSRSAVFALVTATLRNYA